MKKYIPILSFISIFLLITPQVFSGEAPVTINDQMQREKYLFAIDLIRALRYCIQGSKISRMKAKAGKEQLEISGKKISENLEKLNEIEERLEIAKKRSSEGSSNGAGDTISNLNRDVYSKRVIGWYRVYGESFGVKQALLFKYFAKCIGCRISDHGDEVPKDIIDLF